ncbi:MAG: hypothetical protein AAF231_02225 [Pseudomonadota bacterium]
MVQTLMRNPPSSPDVIGFSTGQHGAARGRVGKGSAGFDALLTGSVTGTTALVPPGALVVAR